MDETGTFCICQSKFLLFQVCPSYKLLNEHIQLHFNSRQVSYPPISILKAASKDQPSINQKHLFVHISLSYC